MLESPQMVKKPGKRGGKRPGAGAPTKLTPALERQALFVNDLVVAWAASLLDDLLRRGYLTYHAVYVNRETGRVNPIPVPDPTPRATA